MNSSCRFYRYAGTIPYTHLTNAQKLGLVENAYANGRFRQTVHRPNLATFLTVNEVDRLSVYD
ncbi:MAG TPA: hypothetical protein VFW31_11760 [Candidatus Angelobacter sp.]|nr:hypothetical protein [Candidatus Angelobacter sp.]